MAHLLAAHQSELDAVQVPVTPVTPVARLLAMDSMAVFCWQKTLGNPCVDLGKW